MVLGAVNKFLAGIEASRLAALDGKLVLRWYVLVTHSRPLGIFNPGEVEVRPIADIGSTSLASGPTRRGNIGPPRAKRARLLNALPDIEASDSEDGEGESLEAMLEGLLDECVEEARLASELAVDAPELA